VKPYELPGGNMNEKNIEIIKEVGVVLSRGVLGAIPYVGTALNETIFDSRGRLKQKRINQFVEELSKYLEQINEDQIDFEFIKTDDFGDLFESLLKRVIYNKSLEKLHRFKKILVNQMLEPRPTDYTETFLDIVSKINEHQVEILLTHKKIKEGNLFTTEDNKPERGVIDAGVIGQEPDNDISAFRKADFYGLDNETYKFYIQDLTSKSLLIDDSVNRWDARPFDFVEITQFGIEFLNFIGQ
jgi:hypothetical protein